MSETKVALPEALLERARQKIWIPLDFDTLAEVEQATELLRDHVGCYKIGLQLISAGVAKDVVSYLQHYCSRAGRFYDGKFDDIPNTVGMASKNVSTLGVNYFNVHASAGPDAVEAAVKNKGRAKALAVTVLTSIPSDVLWHLYVACFPGAKPFDQLSRADLDKYLQDVVLEMAKMAVECGADGIICSPQELITLRQDSDLKDVLICTPGVRPEWAGKDDQHRITTPGQAILNGTDVVVIGRPILKPPAEIGGPISALNLVIQEIAEAMMTLADETEKMRRE